MTYETIMGKISSGLTGDFEQDIDYLNKQSQKYKEHKLAKEILRGIGRMIFAILPEDKKAEIGRLTDNHILGMENIVEEAEFQIGKKNFDKALTMLEAMVNKFEKSKLYQDDSVNEYHHFNNSLELFLYSLSKPAKQIRQVQEDFVHPYVLYGFVLLELKQYDKARNALEKALKWNPVKVSTIFELAEIYKIEKKWEKYLEFTNICFGYVYTSQDLARCYRNLGYYYVEQKEYDLASNLYYYSLGLDKSQMAQSQLAFIFVTTGKQFSPPSVKEAQRVLESHKIPLWFNNAVIMIASNLATNAEEVQNIDEAIFYYGILYDITGSENILQKLQKLHKEDT